MNIDFASDDYQRRARRADEEQVVRACLGFPARPFRVLDATAGFAVDAFLLATAGASVIAVERHPVMSQLLQEGWKRFCARTAYPPKLHFIAGDTNDVLIHLQEPIDVVYIDVMFPKRKKTAEVHKSMAWLQDLLKEETSAPDALETLIHNALQCARERVVIKRPMNAPPAITSQKPNFILEGKTCRFEIYRPALWS